MTVNKGPLLRALQVPQNHAVARWAGFSTTAKRLVTGSAVCAGKRAYEMLRL
jgi:hypothetical protein